MKILGHPVHLMLVHFPAALFPIECLFYALLVYTGHLDYAFVSFCILLCGVGFGWVAAIFGALDMASISSEKVDVIKRALIHGSINGTVLIAYTVMAYSLYLSYPSLPEGSVFMLVFKIFLVLFLVIGNFIGGNLVLKDKVGLIQ
ncbi:MAG TPA: DUF2231 domain-containing protein [Cyclobacteriaceae bacterium]|nr:DUF2231 domain-containing protein [Cyclobacteriaceae bacterium]